MFGKGFAGPIFFAFGICEWVATRRWLSVGKCCTLPPSVQYWTLFPDVRIQRVIE